MTNSRGRDPHGGSVPSAVDGARPSEPFADVAETTSGVVFFVGDRAYKLKKPVSLGFLDFSRREAREAACHREVELNRRLAPDVYLGVAEVRGPDGLGEHLVVMRRLPSASRLSSLVTAGVPVDGHLRRLAEVTAAFHARADRSPEIDATASRDATLQRWETNASRMSHLVGTLFEPALADRVLLLARRYLDGREPLFSGRISAGHVCDGHGDLLADDVFCLEDGPRVLDCLDFDDELRYGDVLADVAFMAMDLESLGRPDLADAFLGHYRRSSGETWPLSLAHHYIAYRAQVRALVVGLRSEQGSEASGVTGRHFLELAAERLERGRVRLVVVGGLPGAGKSKLSAEVGRAIGAAVLNSDVIRKRLAGVEPSKPAAAGFCEGIYSAEMTAATYSDLFERARARLSLGESVVLDATFADPEWRAAARSLALETASDLEEFQCVAPLEVMEGRLAERASWGERVSDADVAVLRELVRRRVPWPGALQVDTTASGDELRRCWSDALNLPPGRLQED